MTITTQCVKPNIFSGSILENELLQNGSIRLKFTKMPSCILVELGGRTSVQSYVFNPTTKKQQKMNQLFIERYVNNSISSKQLIEKLFSK